MIETPDHVERHILDTLRRHDLIHTGEGWRLSPADGGLNSQVWFAGPEGDAPVLTVRRSLPGREWVLEREAATLRAIAGSCNCAQDVLGLLHDEWEGSGVMLVLSHATGVPLDLAAVTDSQASALAACLATIHAQEAETFAIWPELLPEQGTRAEAFRARLGAIERYVAFTGTDDDQFQRQIRHSYEQLHSSALSGEGWDERRFALLHGDVSRGNIIWDGEQVTLIDWEYNRAGDPAEELAYLLAEQDVSDTRRELILTTYIEHGGDPTAVSRIPAYAAMVSLDSALWWADRVIEAGDDIATSDEVRFHLSRVNAALTGR